MSVRRSYLDFAAVALAPLSVLLVVTLQTFAAPAPPSVTPEEGVAAEFTAADDSVVKVQLRDKKLELHTKYGTLQIPVADVKRIEFADRLAPDVQTAAAKHVDNLNHFDHKTREDATEALKGMKSVGYPFALKAAKSDDPETKRRGDEIAKAIRAKVPRAKLEVREEDAVYTSDAKLTGKLAVEYLMVGTDVFGDQQVKLSKMRTLRVGKQAPEPLVVATAAPGNMSAFNNQFGKEFTYAVTGSVPAPGANASLWGTDQYTLDSQLAVAVVHAGLAKEGETVVVTVRVVQPPPAFPPSSRNGVTSIQYGAYPAGAYEFVK